MCIREYRRHYLAEIPSPTQGVWHLGPLPIRAYALCILLGIVAACADHRGPAAPPGRPAVAVLDIAIWAVPVGIIGARIYHVITSPDQLLRRGRAPVAGAQHLGGRPGHLGRGRGRRGRRLDRGCRRLGMPLRFFADALAPGLPVAQGIGRWGNWFNNELFGGHTDLPWGLKVYKFDPGAGRAALDRNGNPVPWVEPDGTAGPFHPTFLYESIWDIGVALLVWLVDRGTSSGKGRAFALYVMAYTVGRFWIESHAHRPGAPFPRHADQQLGLDRGLPRCVDLLPARTRSAEAAYAVRGENGTPVPDDGGRARRHGLAAPTRRPAARPARMPMRRASPDATAVPMRRCRPMRRRASDDGRSRSRSRSGRWQWTGRRPGGRGSGRRRPRRRRRPRPR